MRFPHLAQRLFNVPLAITPDKAEIVMAALADRLGIAHLFRGGEAAALPALAFDQEAEGGRRALYQDRGYDVLEGVALVPVCGTLVQKLGTLRPYSGMTGYDGIRQNFLLALEDQQVQAIVLDIDSPGGEVAGCFDLVDEIYNARGEKPIWAILNENAYSAGYAIASAADRVYVPRTGGTGSIGVICMHVDFSQALTEAGLKVTFITHGDRKADGHGEIPLSPEAQAEFQASISATGALFDETVARNRGLTIDAIRAMQARTYQGSAGVSVGLADAVLSPDAAFRALLDELG
jgi:capsid assembly protease